MTQEHDVFEEELSHERSDFIEGIVLRQHPTPKSVGPGIEQTLFEARSKMISGMVIDANTKPDSTKE